MDSSPMRGVLARVHQAVRPADDAPDDRLLAAFVAARDGDAFAALVRRHGRLVHGVCRRVLGDAHDAEDAFQATFLILVRKASSVRRRPSLGAWLHRVAWRVALDARRARARRRARETPALPDVAAAESRVEPDVRALLDRELDRLPEKYRAAVVLCDIDGRTRREAAALLGLAEGTLSGRLTTAHRLLARRLRARGLAAVSVPIVAGAVADAAEAPAALIDATTRAALALAAGAASEVPAPALALMKGALHAMLLRKLKLAAVVSIALAAGLGGGLRLGPGLRAGPAREDPPVPRAAGRPEPRPAERPAGPARRANRTLAGHKSTVYVAFNKAGQLATMSNDRSIRLWDLDGNEIGLGLGHTAPIAAGAFAPDGKTLATTDAQSVRFWDTQPLRERSAHGGPLAGVERLAYSPDGRLLACVAGRGEVRLVDVESLKPVRTLSADHPARVPVITPAIAFSRDGKYLAQAYTDGHPGPSYLLLWDVGEGKSARTLVDRAGADIWAVDFSGNGKLLAAGDSAGKVRLFDAWSWEQVGELDGRGQLRSLAFSPDGRTLALGMRRDIQLWDALTGKRLKTLSGHENWVLSLAFSPDGKWLASGSSDRTARLWPVGE